MRHRSALSGGGGHHHGGHHHGGGGRGYYGPGFGWGWGGWGYPGTTDLFVVDDSDKREADRRAMALIMSLPKKDRAAAYIKYFGTPPPAGALGADDSSSLGKLVIPVGIVILILLAMKKRR